MSKKTDKHRLIPAVDLRTRAEALLDTERIDRDVSPLQRDNFSLLHELQVRQVELELQHDELLRINGELNEKEDLYRNLFEMQPDSVILSDGVTFQILDANPAAEKLYGYSREELTHLTLLDLSAEQEKTQRAVRARKTFIANRLSKRKDGTVFRAEVFVRYFERRGRPVQVSNVRNITERIHAEGRLVELNDKLRALNRHMNMAIELERQAISRDIHDDLGQNLAMMKLDVGWLKSQIPSENREVGSRLDEMLDCVDQLVVRVQQIAADLRPPLLDTAGLAAAIEWHVDELRRRGNLKCFTMLNDTMD